MVDSLREVIASIEQLATKILEKLPDEMQEEIAARLKASLDDLSFELQKEGKDWDTLLAGEEGNQFIDAIRSALAYQEPAQTITDTGTISDESHPPRQEHKGFRLFGKRGR